MASSYLFVGGGSLGHVAPAVAVARALTDVVPDANIHFVCAEREEEKEFLKKEGFTFSSLPSIRRSLMFPVQWLRARKAARDILDATKPVAIFSKGSAISVPLCLEAQRRKIPIVIHESDAVMGHANRITARWAKVTCLGFPSDKNFALGTSHLELIHTGNPIRPAMLTGSKKEGLRLTGLKGNKPILLVLGGSQGAQALNEAVTNHLDALLKFCDIIHITGRGKKGANARAGYWSAEFVHDELAHLYACADLALSRAGASAIAELAVNGVPAILVPIQGLANDHQYLNAIAAQENGSCILLLQSDLDGKLESTVHELLKDEAQRKRISDRALSMHPKEASLHIAKIIAESVAREARGH